MTAHQKKCFRKEIHHIRELENGVYKCRICQHEEKSKHIFKKHLFDVHNDIEVHSKYGRSLQKQVGGTYMSRLRAPIFSLISRGRIHGYISKMLGLEETQYNQTISYDFNILLEEDAKNKVRRTKLYCYSR